jgi:hypothetical protein
LTHINIPLGFWVTSERPLNFFTHDFTYFYYILDGIDQYTVKLSGTELGTLPPLVLGGIIENQNSDFVMA